MKLESTRAPKACFEELEQWFQNRLTEPNYPKSWLLENSFENCMTMPVYRFPIQYISNRKFPIDQLIQTGWNFIHQDLKGNEACFLVSNRIEDSKDVYKFNQANYGKRSEDIKQILEHVQSKEFKAQYSMEFEVALIAGGPKYFYDIWLRSLDDSDINIFIELPPNIYNIDITEDVTIRIKDFGAYHKKLTERMANDLDISVNRSGIREKMKSGI